VLLFSLSPLRLSYLRFIGAPARAGYTHLGAQFILRTSISISTAGARTQYLTKRWCGCLSFFVSSFIRLGFSSFFTFLFTYIRSAFLRPKS